MNRESGKLQTQTEEEVVYSDLGWDASSVITSWNTGTGTPCHEREHITRDEEPAYPNQGGLEEYLRLP